MVKRRDLNAPPARRQADIVREILERSRQKTTGAPGVTDLGENGDVVWPSPSRPSGQQSVKRFSVELDDVTERAEELAEALAGAQSAIADAVEELAQVGRLTTVGPPPANPVVGKTLWVAPNGRTFRAVECEQEAS